MLNKEGFLFISILAFFAILYVLQIIAVGFLMTTKKDNIDTRIKNN